MIDYFDFLKKERYQRMERTGILAWMGVVRHDCPPIRLEYFEFLRKGTNVRK